MATNSTLSSTITPEVLTNDNYANWSVWMENYLLAQDLWDIVEATTEPPTVLECNVVEFKAWRKNNAAALYAILISCGMDILPVIKEIRSAKIVWDKLATMYGPGNSSNILADSSSNNVPEVSFVGEGTVTSTFQTLSDIAASTDLTDFIFKNKFDLALNLLGRYPRVPIVRNKFGTTPLFVLATKSSAFRSGTHLVFWKNWIYACMVIPSAYSSNEIQIEIHNPVLRLLDQLSTNLLKLLGIKQIYEMKLLHHQANQLLLQMSEYFDDQHTNGYYVKEAIFQAIKGGIVEFIDEMVIRDSPLLYTTDTMGRNILFYSVLHRQAEVFRRLSRLSDERLTKDSQDSSRSTILHMAAMLEPSSTRDRIPGEALKMQSELQWFKRVERILPPWIKDVRNDTNMTPKELFTHNHMNMMKEGEKWMKETASACTVIGALIITIMFTAAFTVPGGNDQNTGFPMFSHKKLFTVFIIADGLSLFSSSTSVLVFLGMVTSRYAEKDFSLRLPLKMMIGYYTLFFSIATMMIAFCAGLFIMLPEKSWMVIPTIFLASVTVIQFAFMLFHLLVYMLKQMSEVSSQFALSNLF